MNGKTIAFNVFESTGFFAGVIILLTVALSRSIKRLPTWYMVMVSSTIYSGSMVLLAVAGDQTGPAPGFGLCVFQSALIYAAPVWLVSSGVAFAIQFHLYITFFIQSSTSRFPKDAISLLVVPALLFASVILAVLAIGAMNPEIVERGPYYCGFKNFTGSYIVTVSTIICMIAAFVFEGLTGRLLYRHWRACKDLTARSDGIISAQTIFRLVTFSILTFLSVVTCALYLLKDKISYENIILYNAIIAQTPVFTLGLNWATVKALMFWKKETPMKNQASMASKEFKVQVKVERSSDTHV